MRGGVDRVRRVPSAHAFSASLPPSLSLSLSSHARLAPPLPPRPPRRWNGQGSPDEKNGCCTRPLVEKGSSCAPALRSLCTANSPAQTRLMKYAFTPGGCGGDPGNLTDPLQDIVSESRLRASRRIACPRRGLPPHSPPFPPPVHCVGRRTSCSCAARTRTSATVGWAARGTTRFPSRSIGCVAHARVVGALAKAPRGAIADPRACARRDATADPHARARRGACADPCARASSSSLAQDYGTPNGLCTETAPNSGGEQHVKCRSASAPVYPL